jgi:hypothetical protein
VHYSRESDGENGQYQWDECTERPAMHNLRSFPFKKTMPCFRLNFWFSEFAEMVDGTDESHDRASALYRAKYLTEVA